MWKKNVEINFFKKSATKEVDKENVEKKKWKENLCKVKR